MALAAASVLFGATAAAAPPSAAQKETARTLMAAGDAKLAADDVAGALEAYRAADAIMAAPSTGLALGRALARLGRLVEAVDVLQRVKRTAAEPGEPDAFRAARAAASELDLDLARRIPTVQIAVRGPAPDTPVTVRVDGAVLDPSARQQPQRLDPGEHVLTANAPGYREATARLRLTEGEHVTVTLALAPGPADRTPASPRPPATAAAAPGQGTSRGAPPEPPEPSEGGSRWPSYLAFGVGGAGIVAGAVTGALSLAKMGALEDQCPDLRCDESLRPEHDTVVTLANVSNAAFAIGGAGIAVGVVTLLFDAGGGDDSGARHGERVTAATVRPWVWPGGAGLRGAF